MRNLFSRLFQGRYGSYGMDKFTRFLLTFAVILLIVSLLFTPLSFLYYIAFAIIFYGYFRLFSKNIANRYQENSSYVKMEQRFLGFFKDLKSSALQSKDYHIYKCPSCKQKIRIPRGKGQIIVTCPKCKYEFRKNA